MADLKEELDDEKTIKGIKETKQWNIYRENLLKMKQMIRLRQKQAHQMNILRELNKYEAINFEKKKTF